MFKRILIAINSSPFSLKTAKTGFDLAHALDAEVGLIYMIDRHKEFVSIEAGPTREESELLSLKQAQETIDPDDYAI